MQQSKCPFDKIKPVQISESGIFKYILIELIQQITNKSITLYVRGSNKLQYHAENFEQFQKQLEKNGYKVIPSKNNKFFKATLNNKKYIFKPLGGGRIQHNYNNNKCFIYGYSKSYGRVDHRIAQGMIAKQLGYTISQIKTSQQGY